MTSVAVRLEATAADKLALSAANTSFFALISEDHAWTSLVTAGEAEQPADSSAVMTSLAHLLTGLAAARAGAEWLRDFVLTRTAREITTAIEQTLDEVDDDLLRDAGRSLLEEYGEQLGPLTEAGYAGLLSNETRQFALLLQQSQDVLNASPPDGDLLKNVLCSAATLLISGGMVSTAIPPHVHGPVIAGAGAGAFKVFGCRLDELERREGWRLPGT